MAGRPRNINRELLPMFARWWKREFKEMRDGRRSREVVVGPAPFSYITRERAERELLEKLYRAMSDRRVREICKQSRLWNEKPYVREIHDKAEEFVAARNYRIVRTKAAPGDPDLWERLKQAKTIQQVRNACYSSKWWVEQASPRGKGKAWMRILTKHPDEFLKAKDDKRYPRSDRPSSDNKRLRYLAYAMAGVSCGMSYRSAIDLLEKKRS